MVRMACTYDDQIFISVIVIVIIAVTVVVVVSNCHHSCYY